MSAAVSDRTAGSGEGAEGPATLGQWLDARIPKLDAQRDPGEALTGSGETRRVVDALERLARRVEAQERRGAMGAAAVDRALDDVADRVGAVESSQAETSGRLFEALLGLERVQGGLADRLASWEVEGVRHKAFARLEDRATALETHLAQARTLSSREIEGLREGMSRLGQAAQESIDDLALRMENARFAPLESVEALQNEAALLRKTLSGFQAETNARLHTLVTEGSSAAELATLRTQFLVSSERQDSALSRLTVRLETLAANSPARAELEESARVVSAALAAMAARLDGQDRAFIRKEEMGYALGEVTTQLASLDARLGAGHTAFTAQAKTSAQTASDLSAAVSEVASTVREESARTASQREAMEAAIADVRERIDARAAQAEALSETVRVAANERCEAIAKVTQERIELAEERSAAALGTLEQAQIALDARVRELGEVRLAEETERLQAEFAVRSAALAQEMQDAVSAARLEFEQRLDQAVSAIETGALATGLNQALARIDQYGETQRDLGESVSVELRRWNESQDRRLRGVEARLDDSISATDRLAARFASLEADSLGAAGHTHEALSALSARIEERASAGERRAGQALEQVGTQIIELADRMDHRQRALLQDLEDRLADFERRSSAAAQDHQAALDAKWESLKVQAAPIAPTIQATYSPSWKGVERGIPESIPSPQMAMPAEQAPGTTETDEIAPPAFLIRDPDLQMEDHFIDEYDKAIAPRYDLVDVLDAAISRDSLRRKQAPPSDTVRDMLMERQAAEPAPAPVPDLPAEPAQAPMIPVEACALPLPMEESSEAPSGVFAPILGLEPDSEQEPLDPVDMLLMDAASTPLVLGPTDVDAITLTSAMRVERAPPAAAGLDDLFETPLAKAAAQFRTDREPSYLAAARRATQFNAEQAAMQRKPRGPSVTRAVFWAATAVAVGAGVYAVSRGSGASVDNKPEKRAQPDGDFQGAPEASSTREAAQRTLQGAAEHLAFSEHFEAQPVELPEDGVAAEAAPIAPSTSQIPLQPEGNPGV